MKQGFVSGYLASESDAASLNQEMIVKEENNYVICPFCKEDDFDLIGLKHHYEQGHCDVYNETIDLIKKALEAGATKA